MTVLAFIADAHLGNHRRRGGEVESSLNERCREGLAVLAAAYERADMHGCDAFVVLGDLFDSVRPLPQLIHAVQRIFQGPEVVLLVGNHERVSIGAGDHALGPLDLTLGAQCAVVEAPSLLGWPGVSLGLVPHRPGDAREWLPRDARAAFARAPKRGLRLLGVHVGIADERTPAHLRGSRDAVEAATLAELCRELGVSCVFAGNWHDRRSWSLGAVRILQLGALVPTGWDNPGLDGYGTIAFWRYGEVSVEELPGPRFVRLSADEPEPEAREGTVLRVDRRPVVEPCDAARAGATRARAAATLDEALARCAAGLRLPDGVAPEDVVARAKEYLRCE